MISEAAAPIYHGGDAAWKAAPQLSAPYRSPAGNGGALLKLARAGEHGLALARGGQAAANAKPADY